MWGKYVGVFSNILFVVVLPFGIFNKKHRKMLIACSVLIGIVSIYTNLFPVENLFYSFPTVGDVAKYACEGEIVGILDGKESGLILYSEEPRTVSYMLSCKTASGYKIGNRWTIQRHLTLNPQAPLQILESANAIDKYIYVFGTIEGNEVIVKDTQGNHFFVFERSSIQMGTEFTSFEGFCILSDTVDETYEITVNSTVQSITVRPENY